MQAVETDMTFFSVCWLTSGPMCLREHRRRQMLWVEPLRRAIMRKRRLSRLHLARLAAWLRRYIARVREDATTDVVRRERMDHANPKYVLRNYLAQQAIDALENGDSSVLNLPMEHHENILLLRCS